MAVGPIDVSVDNSATERHSIHPIPLVKPTITAFVGRTERGPLSEPVLLGSFDDFRRVFGGHCKLSFVSYAVQQYFLHGGRDAVVVRVANRASRARIDIPAGDDVLRLQALQPGAHEFLRVSVDYDEVEKRPDKFNLVVQRLRGADSQLVEDQEFYPAVSIDHGDERFIVDALGKSALVRLSGPLPAVRPDARPALHPGEPIPYIKISAVGADGGELTDYDVIGSNSEGTGLFALDRMDGIDLLCLPSPPGVDLGITTFLAAERYCERRRAMLIWDPPWSWSLPEAAVLAVRGANHVSKNAVTYFPRIRPRGDSARFAAGMPACGALAGILARNDIGGVWRTLSEEAAALKTSFAALCDVSIKDRAMLKRFGVNTLTRTSSGSFAFCGNVTLAGPNFVSSIWQRLDRRRLLFFILSSIERATHWVPQQLGESETARSLENQVAAFLHGLFNKGALSGQTESQAFSIRVSPAADGVSNITLRVGIALRKPGEFFSYDFDYSPRGCAITQGAALEAEQLVG